MELATTLKGQAVRNQVREIGINGNHWYAVAWATDLKPKKILPVTVWQQSIALFRDAQNQVQAVENVCPHKGVAMDKGQVKGDAIACAYHGWEFNGQGECVNIPYWNSEQKLPCAQLQTFAVQEKYGLIWIFPGDPLRVTRSDPLRVTQRDRSLADSTPLPDIPQYDDPNWLMIPINGHFKAHFTICNENTMDVFHGYLHKNLQGWFDPILLKLQETENSVKADYQVSYRGVMSKLLGLGKVGDCVTTQVISVDYRYPNYVNDLQGISSLYLMRLPIAPQESRSFAYMFLKVRLPKRLVNLLRPVLQPIISNLLFMPFLRQDIEMIESEQANYLKDPQRRYVEVNPAIIAVQRLMVRQYQTFANQQPSHVETPPQPEVMSR
ncbi:aromatic ring-hydroxylating dioxygenase subunit alpha [Phormidesmis priestleyi]